MEPLPERGTLDAHPLPELLLALYRRRFSGSLRLSRDAVTKRVWLRDGVPVLTESSLPSESLGIQLLDAGRIAREDYARVVETVRQRGCREGAALLALELVAPQDLFAALKEQVRRRLLDCLGWPRGEFALDGEDAPATDAAAFRCDPIGLVQEGVAIHWPPARLRAALAPHLAQYPEATHRFAPLATRLHRDADVERLLAALDGQSPLGVALEGAGPIALAAVWVLDGAGALAWHESAVVAPAAEGEAGDEPAFEIVVGAAAAAGSRRGRSPQRAAAAGAQPSARSAPEAELLRTQILALHADLAQRDHYAMLDVARDADPETVKRAYFGAAKRFHPDALRRLGLEELREAAQAVFARIAQAYETLSDAARRRDYDQGLGQDLDASRVVQAEALFRKAEILLRAGNFAGALGFLAPAVQLWPEECAYQSALGWALYKKSPSDPKTAREHLVRAVELDARDAVAHFRLGLVLRSLGDVEGAKSHADLAKRLDPKVR